MCMYLLWNIETFHRARYATSGKVHTCLDKVGSALLLLSSLFMDPVNNGLRAPNLSSTGTLLCFLILNLLVWMGRTAEIALFSNREAARRESAAELVSFFQVLMLWVLAVIFAWNNEGIGLSEPAALDVAAALMWGSNIWLFLRRGFRAFGAMAIPGQHLPLERQMVCNNISFIHHRNNECMFLMLGETVLQIVIASHEGESTDGESVGFPQVMAEPTVVTALAGFLVALTLMFSFQQINAGQHHASHHLNADIEEQQEEEAAIMDMVISGKGPERKWDMRKIAQKATAVAALSSRYDQARSMYSEAQYLVLKIRGLNVVYDFLWQINAMAVMMSGVAVKLVLYSPTGNASPHSIIATRLIICCPIVLCFIVQLAFSIIKNRHHYTPTTLKQQPVHTLVLSVRVAMLILQICLTWIISTDRENVEVAAPYRFLGVQSLLCLVQGLLLEVQEHKVKIHSNNTHPFARLPLALHALRLKSSQARMIAKAAEDAVAADGVSRRTSRATIKERLSDAGIEAAMAAD